MSRRRKEEKFITFKEQQHREFLKEVFNSVLIAGCFMFASIPVFGVYPTAIVSPDSEWTGCLKIIVNFLYASVGIYLPFLIYNVLKHKSSGRYFTNKGSTAMPPHYILGILAGLGISVSLNYAGSLAVAALRNAGITVNEAVPFTGDSALTQTVFIIAATLIPPFFQEITFRGIVVGDIRKQSYTYAIVLSGLLNGFCFKSFQQIPYFLVLGLLLGWLRLKTDSIVLTFSVNAASHLLMSSLWIFRLHSESAYVSVFPYIALGGAFVALVSVIILFRVYGLRIKRKEEDGAGLEKKEARKAFFGSFALWIFFIFAVIFIMLGQNGNPYLFKEPDPSEETPIVEPTSEQERVSETFTN